MLISWLGEAGIRLQTKDATVVIDPPAASTGMRHGKITGDIVGLTDTDGRDATIVGGQPMILNSPGEYEIKQVFVYGVRLPSMPNQTHWRIEAEDISLGHLADLPRLLDNEELSAFEGVDVLFVPVGGKSVLTAEHAANLISQIEPRIVIPIQYHLPGSKSNWGPVDQFLKEFGAKKVEPQPKIKLTKKDLPAEETQVMLLHVG